MRCLKPRRVGFQSDGKTLAWSEKKMDQQYAAFAIPCGKCIECRLEYARTWAIRCVHEAKMHEENSFITLTYSDENLKSTKLVYKDFQDFAKRLREKVHRNTKKGEPEYEKNRISYFVTGEYGSIRKRPHWHAIIFNWRPSDCCPKYTNERGDQVYSSAILDGLWTHGITEVGSVTFESAGYVARYAAKKLVHGSDENNLYKPISKKSSHRAIGVSWLERYHEDAFNYGQIVLPNGQTCGIPRYYERWLQKNYPEKWLKYISGKKEEKAQLYQKKKDQEWEDYVTEARRVMDQGLPLPISREKVKTIITNEKFKRLQQYLKGDI